MVSVSYCCCEICKHRNSCKRKEVINDKAHVLLKALNNVDLGNGFNVYMECINYVLDEKSTFIKIE